MEAAAIRVRSGAEVRSFHTLIDAGVPVPASVMRDGAAGARRTSAHGRTRTMPCHGCVTSSAAATSSPTKVREWRPQSLSALEPSRAGSILDTQELAWIVSPYLRDHSLASLASALLSEEPCCNALEDARLLLRLLTVLRRSWGETPRRVRDAVAGALAEARQSPGKISSREGAAVFLSPILWTCSPAWMNKCVAEQETNPHDERGPGEEGGMGPEYAVSFFAPGGPLSSLLPDHESRPQQEAMVEAVAAALREAAFLVVEAGTGVGKSLAYLVPGVLHARDGNGPLMISTYTRNLQEQLFHNDLPVLSRALGNFDFALLKGRSNYLCLRKWVEWCGLLGRGEPVLHFGEQTPAESYSFLVSWLSRTASGDLEEISLGLRFLLSELTQELASSSEDCLRSHCAWFKRCWVEKARAQAAASEVVVVNHALLLSQVCGAGEGPSNLILPDYRTLVLDEAHHLEDVATDAFSLSFSLEVCLRTMEDASGRKGLLPRWGSLALDPEGQSMLSEAYELTDKSRSQAEDLCLGSVASLLPDDAGKEIRGYEGARRPEPARPCGMGPGAR